MGRPRLTTQELKDLRDSAMDGAASSDPQLSRYWGRVLDRVNVLLRRPEYRRPTRDGFQLWTAWHWRHRALEVPREPERVRPSRAVYKRVWRRTRSITLGLRPRRPRARTPAERRAFRKQFPKGTYRGSGQGRNAFERPLLPSVKQLAARERFAALARVRPYVPQDLDPDEYSPEQVQRRLAQLKKLRGYRDEED